MNRTPKIYRRGKWWWIRYYEGDTLRREALGTTDRDIAERRRYAKELELLPAGERPTPDPSAHVTVKALVDEYTEWAKRYYRKPDGTPTGEEANIRDATARLLDDYGHLYVADFGPRRLKELRATLIATPGKRGEPLSRNTINARINRIKRIFRWGVENEKVRPETLTALNAVQALKKHRSDAKETEAVEPVDRKHIDAIEPHVSRQVWALIQLQLLTAARPGELVDLRPCDIDMRDSIWVVDLGEKHKTAHHGKGRQLYFGPKAQAILKPFLLREADAFLFSAREGDLEHRRRHAKKKPRRETQKPNPTKTDRKIGEHYTVGSYYAAIQRACKAAGVAPWSPYRLRHTAATEIRRDFGLEAAQVILGHSEVTTTQIYAEKNRLLAIDFAKRNG